jgi:hypothetical protein
MPTRKVGAPDPTLRTSPIMTPVAQEEPAPEVDETHEAVCYFNDEPFAHGSYVQTGDQILRCEHGVWAAVASESFELP